MLSTFECYVFVFQGGVRDPYYPKVQWPTKEMCCHCMDANETVVDFLKVFFSDDSVPKQDLENDLYAFSFCSPSKRFNKFYIFSIPRFRLFQVVIR